ncbi:hypothetical protein HT136_11315 [Novosphingobium profundi]|uniref:hypothetical protein n=1 Tax=Novosphingobium profundi TaxID=1774954 RepID=UPI001BDB3C3B|nr:hypothetical protein [Novosphingobium profundi]MBT0668953.1 hypothetical protein [Novosphingobium profundi]
MNKITIGFTVIAAGVALSGTAFAGTHASHLPKSMINAKAVPQGLQKALEKANEHAGKGLAQAMKHYGNKSNGC